MITLTTLTLYAERKLQQAKTAGDPGIMLRPSPQKTFLESMQQLHPLPRRLSRQLFGREERVVHFPALRGMIVGVRAKLFFSVEEKV